MLIFHFIQMSPLIPDQSPSIVERVSALLSSDPGRSWRVAVAARELAISTRSLQRQLAAERSNFQSILRVTRAEAAAALILEQKNLDGFPLAAVGYASGFSDQAHFSREFKLRFNMSPTDYRAITVGNS